MKLTSSLLKKIILEEMAKFKAEKSTKDAAKEADEVDADEFANSLENQFNYYKALGLEESRLTKRLEKIRELKMTLLRKK
jgi:hypothetical protein